MASSPSIQITRFLKRSIFIEAKDSLDLALSFKKNVSNRVSDSDPVAKLRNNLGSMDEASLRDAKNLIEKRVTQLRNLKLPDDQKETVSERNVEKIVGIALQIGVSRQLNALNESLQIYQKKLREWNEDKEISTRSVEIVVDRLEDQKGTLESLSRAPDSLYAALFR